MTTIRLEYQSLHNVRPRKGEASYQGRLLKRHVWIGANTVEEARQELREIRNAGVEIHAATLYDNATFLTQLTAWDTKKRFRPTTIERHNAESIRAL